jgi:hypothetical protein
MTIRRVEYDGERIYPSDFTDDDMYTGNQPGTTSRGRPTHYQAFNSTLYLRPIPDTSALTIRVFSYNQPSQPSSAGTLDVPARYHLYLADYALYCMFAQDKNPAMADRHLRLWTEHKSTVMKIEQMRRRSDEFAVVKDIEEGYLEPRWI